MQVEEGRGRVVVESVKPEIDCGRYPIKRTVGESVVVEADIFTDGHDAVSAVLQFRKQGSSDWSESPMTLLFNDRWSGRFTVTELGRYEYCLLGWVDPFQSWRRDFEKRLAADQKVGVDLTIGAQWVREAAGRATGEEAALLQSWADLLKADSEPQGRIEIALSGELLQLMKRHSDRRFATRYGRDLEVVVDRERARFSAWYEMFPRSCSGKQGRHGTFKDCERHLKYVAGMGFDVLYLPPIHPIGRTHRKGKNNVIVCGPEDPGSPWAIGAKEGGHKAVHPELGTLDDFHRLVAKAGECGLEIALDLAFQCAPDHPYVREHPEWFRHRPDGSIQYAENPPKKYQDIYPFHFETEDWRALWEELRSVVLFWIDQGVKIFRVDNPHTKPFGFWEWLLNDVKKEHPDAIFLSEAFTRPKVMYELAKLGFNQSYTYFAWRNMKWEITDYFTELARSDVREYFRPNLWPNTPDILTEQLQYGGRPAFVARLVLAATLGASYGIYGPAFELCENRAREFRSEEYLDSEKYEIRHWDLDSDGSLKDLIGRVNAIRRENRALQSNDRLTFHAVDNDHLICYSKATEDNKDIILVVANLDPHHTQAGWVEFGIEELGIHHRNPYQVHDLLSGSRFLWQGARNYVSLDPRIAPAHILRVRRRVRSEHDFDYYM